MWSAWSRLNAVISKTCAIKREVQRKQSREMLKKMVHVLRALAGPKFAASFEWPHTCDGYDPEQCPEIKDVFRLLPLVVRTDGCAHGLRSLRNGLPLLKRWRIQTSCASM